jgi:hypothetical protein
MRMIPCGGIYKGSSLMYSIFQGFLVIKKVEK